MNIHSFLDNLIVKMMKAVAGKRRIFSKSIESPSFSELMPLISLKVPKMDGVGIYRVEAETPAGLMNPAFKVQKWLGNDFPTIIYHHGNSERPFKIRRFARNTFFKIFINTDNPVEANLIALCSPMHNIPVKVYQQKLTELINFTVSFAVMAKLVEELLVQIKTKSQKPVIVSGISFGGFVTNLHRAFFGTADTYIPMLAGSSMEKTFTQSGFYELASDLVKDNPEKMKEILNFDKQFMGKAKNNIFPLLGKYDQFVRLESHLECYENHPVNIIERGHLTTAFSPETMREHILSQVT
jgi:hypothetical protein